ncbi:hypothetical protein IMG5_151320 [Ichthyophthirius multifiliis]|uniref:F-box domain-containing protein n=1 Tax=Ichthyophthirius multifiliis TaxID=5932 RepID=G0QYN5_ICHMU|nr:hypothetical protein IMG5_151320 [Ichthyophthirius multifiliis]EGR29662.1 hypothetical protein IMG5_151320 [Ichthyophthirius multifiliis]|eukprot:XP_004030898.1 hypothetical protein IMG5_151320 [Ichthyophthirius multifiliis]
MSDSQQSNLNIQYFNEQILIKIFTFLNVMDLCIITRVSKKWKSMIQKNPDIYAIVNLSILGPNIKTLNLMKIVQSDKNIKKLYLPFNANSSDTCYLLMSIPKTLEFLQINNINIEFAAVFNQKIQNLRTLELQNRNKRKKNFDENEMKAIQRQCPNLTSLTINKAPINDKILCFLLKEFKNLQVLNIPNTPKLTNVTLEVISKFCVNLEELHFGGSPSNFNMEFSVEGFKHFEQAKFQLKYIKLHYCARVGDSVLQILGQKFKETLIELQIVRNCFEKCAKISDQGVQYLSQCVNLEKLNISYSRKFRDKFHLHISSSLRNLKYLCIRDCPIQEDLSVFARGCPNLEEVDLSGDSWVTSASIVGLSKHPQLKILHLGHYDHGDTNCDENLEEYPPKGMFIEGVFKNKDAFPRLHLLFLEQNCSLTYWLDVKLQKIRSGLKIRYTPAENLFSMIE